jgi:hypothetical protein
MSIRARLLSLVAFLVAVLTLTVPTFAAPIVTNGNFAAGDFTGFTLSGDSDQDYVFGFPGNFAAALTTSFTTGSIAHTITDTAGQSYTLTFQITSDSAEPNSLVTSVGGVQLQSLTNVADAMPDYLTETFNFVGKGSDIINFTYRDDPGYIYLTNIAVNPAANVTAITPEPSSFVLLGTGILGTAGACKRRFAVSQS